MRNEMASYFEDPQFKNSLAKYEDMVKNHVPAYLEANELTDIAEYYASQEREEDADEVVRFGLSIHPDDIDLLIFKSRSLALKGRTEEARQVMALITDQGDREVKFLLFDILLEEYHADEADQVLNDLAAEEGYSMEVMVDIMQTYIDNEHLGKAKEWYDKVDQAFDIDELIRTNKRCRSIFCDYYLSIHDNAHCVPILQEMLDESPYNIGLWNDLARCYLDMNEEEKATEAVDFSLAIDDRNLEALQLKSMCFEAVGNLKECVRLQERMVELGGRFPYANLQLVKTYLNLRDYEHAEAHLEKIDAGTQEQKEPMRPELQALIDGFRAIVYAWRHKFEKASRLIDNLLKTNLFSVDAHLAAGHCALLRGEHEYAREQFRIAIEKATSDGEGYDAIYESAGLLFDFRDLQGAAEIYRQMITEYPDDCAGALYIALYCFAYERDIRMFYHCYARIRKEMPDLYAEFGHVPGFNDPNFDNLLLGVRNAIDKGDIDIDKYLSTPDF